MNYKNIYSEEIEKQRENFPELSDTDILIIILKKEGYSYGDIQLATGNPSKSSIRKLLKNYIPELLTN